MANSRFANKNYILRYEFLSSHELLSTFCCRQMQPTMQVAQVVSTEKCLNQAVYHVILHARTPLPAALAAAVAVEPLRPDFP